MPVAPACRTCCSGTLSFGPNHRQVSSTFGPLRYLRDTDAKLGRHARLQAGHPRVCQPPDSWIPGPSPGMTTEFERTAESPRHQPHLLLAEFRQIRRRGTAFEIDFVILGREVRCALAGEERVLLLL